MFVFRSFAMMMLLASSSAAVSAQQLIEEYRAFISDQDLHNSSGVRLTKPWEIIRQDRANYHKFSVPDPDDYYDSFFAIEANRALVEELLQRGRIEQTAGQSIVDGSVYVRVRIYSTQHGRPGVTVTVE